MGKNNIGRPTEAIKDAMVKVRIDSQTKRMLEYCVSYMELSKSDVIRAGIEKMYEDVKNQQLKEK